MTAVCVGEGWLVGVRSSEVEAGGSGEDGGWGEAGGWGEEGVRVRVESSSSTCEFPDPMPAT